MKLKTYREHFNEKGFVVSIITFFILIIMLSVALSMSTLIFYRQKISTNAVKSTQSYYTAESGIEDAVHRIKNNKPYSSNYNLAVGQGSATINISGVNTKTVTSKGDLNNIFRNLQATLSTASVNPQFFYGAQAGEGGVAMGQNSKIQGSGGTVGNLYSNGPITGSNGATITGDVIVATGVSLDAQHAVYNSDFSFGTNVGSIITLVDSAGDAGSYNSIALGSDGFARISYIASKSLKFVRCLNADCSAKNITTLDTAGGDGIDEVTSLVLGSDGLARISYYHDQNDDLNFIRCLDADCTTRVTTVVDSTNNVGDASALKLGLDGLPRLAYLYDTSDNLRFARCTNADCTAKNITTVDSSGIVGEPHISLAIGDDGFGRISYYDDGSGDNLNFARCINDDCTMRVITTVDSVGQVGQYTSVAMGNDGFARISYYDVSNGDLKFARCTNDDCATRVITTVDSLGTVGQYTSVAMGNDGFARISYYDSSNGNLKFVRCANADCTVTNISTVDSNGNVGRYTSLALDSNSFGRISYYDVSNSDLKYIRCSNGNCPPSELPADVAQSFKPTQSKTLAKVSLYLKKFSNPPDATIRITADASGSPSQTSLASATLNSSLVTTSYGWIDTVFSSPPNLTAGNTYWIILDYNQDGSKYWIWGMDINGGYIDGSAKYSKDWTSQPWQSITGDLDFKIYLGTGLSSIDNAVVYGTTKANTITNSKICGDGYYQSIDSSSATFLANPTNPTCPNPLTLGTGYPNQPDPPVSPMPISEANITQWKTDVRAGVTVSGDYNLTNNASFGPGQITGNLNMTSSNKTLTVTGTIYVNGNIDIDNGSTAKCDPSFWANSCLILADGWIHLSNNSQFQGSGTSGSYIMLLSTLQCDGSSATSPNSKPCGHHNGAIDLHNNASGAIFYAGKGLIKLHNGVNVTELTAYKMDIDNTAVVSYEQGLSSANFSSGPGGSWKLTSWQEK